MPLPVILLDPKFFCLLAFRTQRKNLPQQKRSRMRLPVIPLDHKFFCLFAFRTQRKTQPP